MPLWHAHAPDYKPVMVDPDYEGWRIVYVREEHRRFGSAPMVIGDTMDGTKNPVDGKMYDSKSNYYRKIKESGCVIVGNDSSLKNPQNKVKELSSHERKSDIARAMHSLS